MINLIIIAIVWHMGNIALDLSNKEEEQRGSPEGLFTQAFIPGGGTYTDVVVDTVSPAIEVHQSVAGGQLTAQEFLPLGVTQPFRSFDVIDRDYWGRYKHTYKTRLIFILDW